MLKWLQEYYDALKELIAPYLPFAKCLGLRAPDSPDPVIMMIWALLLAGAVFTCWDQLPSTTTAPALTEPEQSSPVKPEPPPVTETEPLLDTGV
jgi:hypothetical protein